MMILHMKTTEKNNPAALDLDLRATEDILHLINVEDQGIAAAVGSAIPEIARAVDETAARLRQGGHVYYVGAGTSGRIGILDAAEIAPTFGSEPDRFQAVIAGGYEACYQAAEAYEDDGPRGAHDLRSRGCRAEDVVVGISAGGDTPYTLGALQWARSEGALTIAVCCNRDTALPRAAEIAITPVVGPEIIAGSTRMKAGTAQKMVLNMFSTGVMVRVGSVFGHWMVNMQMTNAKLRERGLRMLQEATGMPGESCRAALSASGMDLPVALVMLLGGIGPDLARNRLRARSGNVRETLETIRGGH